MNGPSSSAYEKNLGVPVFPRIIKGFPYPQRFCPYCERELEVINAIHDAHSPEIFKCLMLCQNSDCEVFDEEAKKAYLRAYYSSEEALQKFETILLRFQRIEKT